MSSNIALKKPLGRFALYVVILFCFIAVYAPCLASSKPFVVEYEGVWFFPFFRYLFYRGFYTKGLDIFFNLLMFTIPLLLLAVWALRKHMRWLLVTLGTILLVQTLLFFFFAYGPAHDPASNSQLMKERHFALATHPLPDWQFDLKYLSPYARLNLLLKYQQRLQQKERLAPYIGAKQLPTLWQQYHDNEEYELKQLQSSEKTPQNTAAIAYIIQRNEWLEHQVKELKHEVMPLIRPFHWQDDAGGNQDLNGLVPFWELTRINRSDLVAALIFGTRISLVVGILAVALSLAIGLPIGAIAGYYGGTTDIVLSRFLEIWEAMPTFFMLLMAVAILQNKSIFIVITIIGLFGWTSFSRYLRGEFFKQKNFSYVEACRAMGFKDSYIMFSHIFPNAIPPVLTLLPFAIMGAIASEAGLSFLGLGEEGSCSWGVLMDEGRSAFPSEAYLLWPPAIMLTTLLVAIALVGDAFRDTLDPKLR